MDAHRALYPSFVDGVAEDRRASLDEAAATAALIGHWDEGRASWPGLELTPQRFAGDLARRLGADPGAALAAACGRDVYLAIACCDGEAAAITQLDELIARSLRQAASRVGATAEQAHELAAELRRILLIDEDDRRAALRDYAGRGDLRSYVRVSATRALIRAVNRGRREVAVDDVALFDRMVPAADPELSILRAQYRETVDVALRAALAGLEPRARALLRYQLIDGWSIDQVGKLYGVHRATAARWIADARETLGTAIRRELANRLQIETDEVDSIVRLVQSRVDMSLDRLLVPDAST